ncbi:MAG TPA: response regulator transcription factor [Rudaea sp.]|nr:response regulator transcription factor [Rudaea sp.]
MNECFLLVDDEPALLDRLRRILSEHYRDTALECAETIAQAKALCANERFTMALVDLGLPDGSGADLVQWLRERDEAMPILVISAWSTEEKIVDALRAGASGYILKERDDAEIAMLIGTALKGGAPIDPFIARRILALSGGFGGSLRPSSVISAEAGELGKAFSERETEILELVAEGLSNIEIAEKINLSRWTVATHVKNIYAKLAVHTRTAAVQAARGRGLLR